VISRGQTFSFFALERFCSAWVWSGHSANPELIEGRFLGPIFAVLSALMIAFFCYVFFYELRQVPASMGAPRVGQRAPEFTLSDQNNKPVALADLLSDSKAVVLIFYRGFW